MSSQAILALALLAASQPPASAAPSAPRTYTLDGVSGLVLKNVLAEPREHAGRKGVRLVEAPGAEGETIALLPDSEFGDGAIEVELAGRPAGGAPEGSRGFVGIAFRVDPASLAHECFYLRPTNGRAQDQLRRNHSTQYVSHPGFPWHRLRKEQPGLYESYVDLEPGAWTRVRIVVSGTSARLFLHGAEQPALIVNDLKRGRTRGAIALWIGQGTEAFFRSLRVEPAGP